jgi:hypothetical protein
MPNSAALPGFGGAMTGSRSEKSPGLGKRPSAQGIGGAPEPQGHEARLA